MDSSTHNGNFDHLQDIIGQLPSLRAYAQICLCFPTSRQHHTKLDVIRELRTGLNRLGINFQWLMGRVVIVGQNEHSTGLATIEKHASSIPLFVNDLSAKSSMPTMTALRNAGFPFSMLDRDVIAPLIAMPGRLVYNDETISPVLVLHATLIDGGLLLNFAGHHHTMDMNGLGQIIRMLSKCCRNESLSQAEIYQGNCDRRNVVPILGCDYQPGPELDWLVTKSSTSTDPPKLTSVSTVIWVYFNFDAASCKRLKCEASEQDIVDYITTNDAICALFWQRLTKARAGRIGQPLSSVMMRAVDARPYLGVSRDYLGHMVSCTYYRETDVFSLPLGEVAGKVRQTLQKADFKVLLPALATVLERTPNKTVYNYGANLDTTRDVIFSSWAQNPAIDSDFGPLLGKPEAARRARFTSIESLIYVMPKSSNGDLALGACLREDDITVLRADQTFMSYATYIG